MIQALRAFLAALREHQEDTRHKKLEQRYWKWSLVLTSFAILFAAAAFWASWRQATYARMQANYAQQQLDEVQAEQRPWLKVTASVASDFVYLPETNSNLNIRVTVTNLGHEAAFNVNAQTRAAALTKAHPSAARDLLVLCRRDFADPAYTVVPQMQSSIVFPDDPTDVGLDYVYVDDKPIDSGYGFSVNSVFLLIYGCAYYAYGDPLTFHHSGFVYLLGLREANGLIAPLPLHQTVPQAQLELTQQPVGSDVTN